MVKEHRMQDQPAGQNSADAQGPEDRAEQDQRNNVDK